MKCIYFLKIKPSHIGSMELFLCDLSKKMGCDFTIAFTEEPTEAVKKFFLDNGCNYIILKEDLMEMLLVFSKYDIVLTGFFRLNAFLVFLLRVYKVKYVYVHHNSYFEEDLIKNISFPSRPLKKIKRKLTYSLTSKVICVSKFIENELNRSGISKSKLICIHNGVSVERNLRLVSPNSSDLINQNVLTILSNGKNKFKCIFIGSLELFKGADILLETALSIPYVDFYFAGNGSLKNSIQEAEKKNTNIFYLGLIHNFAKYTHLFNFAIVPSQWHESFCYSALEALYSNLPVIASNKGALPEVLGNRNVIYINSVNAETLKSAINNMILNITDKKILLINEKPLSIEKQVESYVNLLRGFV